ncbi:MAG: flagellar hook assembly protein FlgD [Bdellovibrionota bacterium]
MNSTLQNRIAPPQIQSPHKVSDAKINSDPDASDSNGGRDKVDFKSLLLNSNQEVIEKRNAKNNGDLSKAGSYQEFLQNLDETATKQRTPKNELDKDDFLKLFITQLQNQDPLKPKDGAEMASQLAQFNSVEQMVNFNKGLERLEKAQTAGQSMNYINYIGKEISVNNGRVRLSDSGIGNVSFKAPTNLSNVRLDVRDTSGALVATKDLGSLMSGSHKLSWDGTGKDGEKLANANYTVSVSAKDTSGIDVPIEITNKVKITGIDLSDGNSQFYTNLGRLKVNEIASIGDQGFADVDSDSANLKQSTAPNSLNNEKDEAVSGKNSTTLADPSQPNQEVLKAPVEMSQSVDSNPMEKNSLKENIKALSEQKSEEQKLVDADRIMEPASDSLQVF